MKIAIVGTAPSNVMTPFGDESFKVWTHNGAWDMERSDVHFQMHEPERGNIEALYDARYVAWLERRTEPTYTMRKVGWIPSSVALPIGSLAQEFGEMWGNTACYMLAMAIQQGAEEIALCGIELIDTTEYLAQRECVQFFRGLAMGRGIKVTFPGGSALEKRGVRYGYQEPPEVPQALKDENQRHFDNAKQRHLAAMGKLQHLQGAHAAFLHVGQQGQAQALQQQIAECLAEIQWANGAMSAHMRTDLTAQLIEVGG